MARSTAGLLLALNSKPDAFMITASSGAAATDLMVVLRRNGSNGPILGGNAFNSATSSKIAGADGKGAQSAAAWYAGNETEENQEFVRTTGPPTARIPTSSPPRPTPGSSLAEALDDVDLTYSDTEADRGVARRCAAGRPGRDPARNLSAFTADHDVNQPIWIVQMNGKGGFDLVEEIPAK